MVTVCVEVTVGALVCGYSLCRSHCGSSSVCVATVCVEVSVGALVCGYSLCRSLGSSSVWPTDLGHQVSSTN